MKPTTNAVEWFEIPSADLGKAIPFYNQVLDIKLEAKEFGPNQIAIFPYKEPGVGGCIMQGPGLVPSGTGSVAYLSTKDMDETLKRVEPAGGKIVIGKTPIGPDTGFFARIHDLEGNLVGLCALK